MIVVTPFLAKNEWSVCVEKKNKRFKASMLSTNAMVSLLSGHSVCIQIAFIKNIYLKGSSQLMVSKFLSIIDASSA